MVIYQKNDIKNNLNPEKQDDGLVLSRQEKDFLPDLMKQLVIYQKKEVKWDDLVELEEIEEGEILDDRRKFLVSEETQNVKFQPIVS